MTVEMGLARSRWDLDAGGLFSTGGGWKSVRHSRKPLSARTANWLDGYFWLRLALLRERQGADDIALKIVYRKVGDWLSAGNFHKCDALLQVAQTDDLPLDFLLALLTVTLRWHRDLPSRPDFFGRVAATLARRGVTDERILAGLG
jgi:hypothetical protein